MGFAERDDRGESGPPGRWNVFGLAKEQRTFIDVDGDLKPRPARVSMVLLGGSGRSIQLSCPSSNCSHAPKMKRADVEKRCAAAFTGGLDHILI